MEDAFRLQARPEEGRNLGFGTWLGEDAWVPGELPSVGSNQTWDRLRKEYPGLAEIAATNPGRLARESYLREVAAERVRTGLGQLARTGRRATSGSSSGGEASEEETAADRGDSR